MREKAIEPPEGPIPAWEQIQAVANRLGANWNYQTAADVMDEIGRAVPFYSGATLREPVAGVRPAMAVHEGQAARNEVPCLKKDCREAGFQFSPLERPEGLAKLSAQYPFVLAIGYSLYYWHRNILVRHSETLRREYGMLLLDYPDGFVEINTEDARRLGVRDGAQIRLVAKTGSVRDHGPGHGRGSAGDRLPALFPDRHREEDAVG